jgi:Mce-associated membrane protein
VAWKVTNRPLTGAIVVLAVAAVFAGWSGWSWLQASHDDSLAYANARDAALSTGRAEVATLNSLDYHQVDAGIASWLAASTGALHDQLAGTDDKTKKALAAQDTVATGKVLDAGIDELDDHAGTAKMLASVEVTIAKAGSAPSTKRNRFAAQLTRTDAGWKLSALDQVPVGSS